MLCSPQDVQGRLCEHFARPRKSRDVPGILEITTVVPGRAVIRKEVDDIERELRDEETRVHGQR